MLQDGSFGVVKQSTFPATTALADAISAKMDSVMRFIFVLLRTVFDRSVPSTLVRVLDPLVVSPLRSCSSQTMSAARGSSARFDPDATVFIVDLHHLKAGAGHWRAVELFPIQCHNERLLVAIDLGKRRVDHDAHGIANLKVEAVYTDIVGTI